MQDADPIDKSPALTRSLRLPDGRRLAYLEVGDPAGRPLLVFHGLPGSRIEALALHEGARIRGLRVIAPDRPGFGESSPKPGRRILDWPQDVVALADALALSRFGVLGVSGGGPFALACAYAVPARLTAVIDVAGSAPFWTHPARLRQLPPIRRSVVGVVQRMPALGFQLAYASLAWRIRRVSSDGEYARALSRVLSPTDRALVQQPPHGRRLARDAREAFRQGVRSVAAEARLNYDDWGFDIADITIPVHVFHGTDDLLVPFAFGEYKSRTIPHAVFNVVEGAGHFQLMLRPDPLLDYVAALGSERALDGPGIVRGAPSSDETERGRSEPHA